MNLPLSLSRMRQLAPLALVFISAAAAVAAYLQALDYPFVSDDIIYITQNSGLAALHPTELWRLFTGPYNAASEFLPLREFSYWTDMTLFGLNPSAFRAHNIILYLLCLPLVYATTLELWRYFRPADAAGAPWAAAATTVLFALHPALVEPVVWVSGRKYVLPNLFSMLALWLALRARREHGLSVPHAAAALGAFVAVMLSKASYAAVAPVIALLWLFFWLDIPAPYRRRSLLLWPISILFLAGLLTVIFIASSIGKSPAYFGIEAAARALAVLGWLARLALTPENRHLLYPVLDDPYLPAMVAMGITVLAACATGGVLTLRKRSIEGFALAVFFLLCMPYLQLVPYALPSLVQDRFLALAVWPVMLLLVSLSWRLKPVLRAALLLAIALPWVIQSTERPRDWRSNETLLEADLRAYPGYYLPAMYKIIAFQLPRRLFRDAGETASSISAPIPRNIMMDLINADYAVFSKAVKTGKPSEAMAFIRNLELTVKQPPARTKWDSTMLYVWMRCQNRLALQWEYLAERFPDDVSVRYKAGLWMLDAANYNDAVTHLRAATGPQRLPESERGTAFYNLGLALMKSGLVAEAEAPLRSALEQSPPDLRARSLLLEVYKQTKRFE